MVIDTYSTNVSTHLMAQWGNNHVGKARAIAIRDILIHSFGVEAISAGSKTRHNRYEE